MSACYCTFLLMQCFAGDEGGCFPMQCFCRRTFLYYIVYSVNGIITSHKSLVIDYACVCLSVCVCVCANSNGKKYQEN